MEESYSFELFGISFGLNVLLSLIATIVIVSLLCYWMTRNLSVEHPSRPQVMFEYLIDFIRGIVKDQMGDEIEPSYVGISIALFLFILIANVLGLPFLVERHEMSLWKSPTADLAVCFAMSITMNVISHILGMKKKGVLHYWKSTYFEPNLIGAPIKVIEELINMLTLAMRLFGNIYAGEVLLNLIAKAGNAFGLGTWVAGIPLQMIWQGFSVFIGAIQAYIFVTLSMVYLSDKVLDESEE